MEQFESASPLSGLEHSPGYAKHADERTDSLIRILSAALEQSMASIVITDINGIVEHANSMYLLGAGVTLERAVGRHLSELGNPYELDLRYAEFLLSVKHGNPAKGEFLNRKANGEETWESIVATPLKDNNGAVTNMFIVKVDVTQRKKMEETLRESEARFRQLAHLAPAGIYSTDVDGEKVFVNTKWCDMTGISEDDARRKGWLRAIHPGDRKRIELEIQSAREEAKEYHVEQRLLRPDGQVTWVTSTAVPIANSSGDLTGYVGVMVDISAQKEIEDKLAQANRFKDSLLSNIGHELRTPLNGILCLSELLKDDLQDDRQADMMRSIYSAAERLTKTLTSLMYLSEIESRSLSMKPRETDLTMLVRRVAEAHEDAARENGLELHLKVGENPLTSYLDELLLESALGYVVENAVKFTPSGGVHIELRHVVENACSLAEITVSDSGIGIPEEFHQAVFEPFFQVSDGMHRKFEGSGLGLTLSQRIIEAMQGTIALQSQVQTGTTVRVRFPSIQTRI